MGEIIIPRTNDGNEIRKFFLKVAQTLNSTLTLEDTIRDSLARAYLGSNQIGVADATLTTVELDTEVFDIGDNFASYIYTFPVTGYYQINFRGLGFCATAHNLTSFFAAVADGTDTNFLVGTRLYGSFPQNVLIGSTGSGLVYKVAGATAKLRVYADMDNAAATLTVYAGAASTYLDVYLIST